MIQFILSVCAAGAWFTAMVAGSFIITPERHSRKADLWYICSVVAVLALVNGAYLLGKAGAE